ncbi:MAG TPA: hypothetical protein PKK84_08920 [Armatimonadota bacterium]|nr:hypothetical protein [Armatimonadota bacterium]
MKFRTTIRVWQALGGVEGEFNPLAAEWDFRFETPAFCEPLPDSSVSTLFGNMRADGARFFLDESHPEIGYRWLIKDQNTNRFYLVEPAAPRYYDTGIPHIEVNARRMPEG